MGIDGKIGHRNALSLLNRRLGKHFFWDGRVESLELQALEPIQNPDEMANTVDAVLARLRSDPEYVSDFDSAFGPTAKGDPQPSTTVTAENLGRAIASFERTLSTGPSAADLFRKGKYDSLTSSQRKGMWIFESRGRCWMCHSGDNLTDEEFHNTGVGFGDEPRDLGRYKVTHDDADRYRFKTPSLRGVALTAPYFYNGSAATLDDVVRFYNHGGSQDDPQLDSRIRPLNLSQEEAAALADFLRALTPEATADR